MKFFLVALLLSSCSNYIRRMHQDFDRHDNKVKYHGKQRDELSLYKKRITSAGKKFVPPKVKRRYRPGEKSKKRYRAGDLDDNRTDGSLWSESSSLQGFLFSKNKVYGLGDIILLQVQGRLKDEITTELKRVFVGVGKVEEKKGTEQTPADAGSPAAAAAAPAPSGGGGDGEKVFDVISSVIVNEVNNSHLLVQGRKQLLFKDRKRLVEIQALVSRYDIESGDTLKSNKIIEHQIQVVR